MKLYQLKICWGYYDENGFWHHNPFLEMSADEQLRQNVIAGYTCREKSYDIHNYIKGSFSDMESAHNGG